MALKTNCLIAHDEKMEKELGNENGFLFSIGFGFKNWMNEFGFKLKTFY